jgi:hypothetical protein
MDSDELTALHEAGHAVAHARLGIQQLQATIVAQAWRAGAVTAEGLQHVWNAEQAGPMVEAYCAGYAALIAAGHDEAVAASGCEDDFESAERLIQDWGLAGTLDIWKARAVALMSQPDNKRAAALVAEHLLAHKRLDSDYLNVLVEMADGECTEAEFQQYLALRGPTA